MGRRSLLRESRRPRQAANLTFQVAAREVANATLTAHEKSLSFSFKWRTNFLLVSR